MKYYIKYNGQKLNNGKSYSSIKEATQACDLICATYGYMPEIYGEDIEYSGPDQLGGFTKREQFAAMAMQSMLPATFSQNGFQRGTADGLADYAVKVADALIKALNK
ncbi:hypothetical protein FKG96_12310 [Olivibacter sp. LS-1]|uniref:hypothetical protein n=1 Tax=Olivibacter sp. LS-1 TaxID=2592345 RepID=UPI0011EACF20|nr:hypothetical protein [Olivibacter sp. LS-1]QEL01555.1 hypothetical protein FKG96_12310 [Olivibacter sp. LS-1]